MKYFMILTGGKRNDVLTRLVCGGQNLNNFVEFNANINNFISYRINIGNKIDSTHALKYYQFLLYTFKSMMRSLLPF